MNKDYICPYCNSHLVSSDHIVLSLDSEHSKKRGLILLNVELGNYSYLNHPSLRFEKGEIVDLYCPVCHANLKIPEINENLVRLIFIDKAGKKFDVYFSRVAGEHSTFKINKDDIIEQFGEDASAYLNYFTSKLKQILH
jgi:hypothetical protein